MGINNEKVQIKTKEITNKQKKLYIFKIKSKLSKRYHHLEKN
jgi:hypothetical protein